MKILSKEKREYIRIRMQSYEKKIPLFTLRLGRFIINDFFLYVTKPRKSENNEKISFIVLTQRQGLNLPMFYEQLLRTQIPKVQRDAGDLTVLLRFWYLHA